MPGPGAQPEPEESGARRQAPRLGDCVRQPRVGTAGAENRAAWAIRASPSSPFAGIGIPTARQGGNSGGSACCRPRVSSEAQREGTAPNHWAQALTSRRRAAGPGSSGRAPLRALGVVGGSRSPSQGGRSFWLELCSQLPRLLGQQSGNMLFKVTAWAMTEGRNAHASLPPKTLPPAGGAGPAWLSSENCVPMGGSEVVWKHARR